MKQKWLTVKCERVIEEGEPLPPKRVWSRTALAAYAGVDRETLGDYEVQFAVLIDDYRSLVKLDEQGKYRRGLPLCAYQAWALVRIAHLLNAYREEANGYSYKKEVKQYIRANQHLFDSSAYQYFLSQGLKVPA